MASVELKGLGKRYGNAVAVDDVSLLIEHGQLVCLLGPSGCGKTTTLRLIAGFIEPSAGEIVVGGKMLSSHTAHDAAGRPQHVDDLPELCAVAAHDGGGERRLRPAHPEDGQGHHRRPSSRRSCRRRGSSRWPSAIPASCRAASSSACRWRAPWWSSRRRCCSTSRLSNLDANLREEMRFEIRRLHDQYRYTTVYVTHDQSEAMTTADQIAVMNLGRIEQLGTPKEIYDAPRSVFVARFIGGSNILDGRAVDATHVAIGGSTLETTGRTLTKGEAVPVSIRQHEIEIVDGRAVEPQSASRRRHAPGVSRCGARLHGRARRQDRTSSDRTAGAGHRAGPDRCGCVCRPNDAGR